MFNGIFDFGGKNGGFGHMVAIPFYSEQIKEVTNENPTKENKDIRYSLKLTDCLGKREIDMFWDKIGERKRGTQFPKSRNNDSILTIGNKLVYVGRGYQNPKVNKIVEVIVEEDTEYENTYTSFVQEDIINDYERNGIYKNTSLKEYTSVIQSNYSDDFDREVTIREYKERDSRTNRQNGLGRKGQVRETTHYHFGDEQERSGDTGESGSSKALRRSLVIR